MCCFVVVLLLALIPSGLPTAKGQSMAPISTMNISVSAYYPMIVNVSSGDVANLGANYTCYTGYGMSGGYSVQANCVGLSFYALSYLGFGTNVSFNTQTCVITYGGIFIEAQNSTGCYIDSDSSDFFTFGLQDPSFVPSLFNKRNYVVQDFLADYSASSSQPTPGVFYNNTFYSVIFTNVSGILVSPPYAGVSIYFVPSAFVRDQFVFEFPACRLSYGVLLGLPLPNLISAEFACSSINVRMPSVIGGVVQLSQVPAPYTFQRVYNIMSVGNVSLLVLSQPGDVTPAFVYTSCLQLPVEPQQLFYNNQTSSYYLTSNLNVRPESANCYQKDVSRVTYKVKSYDPASLTWHVYAMATIEISGVAPFTPVFDTSGVLNLTATYPCTFGNREGCLNYTFFGRTFSISPASQETLQSYYAKLGCMQYYGTMAYYSCTDYGAFVGVWFAVAILIFLIILITVLSLCYSDFVCKCGRINCYNFCSRQSPWFHRFKRSRCMFQVRKRLCLLEDDERYVEHDAKRCTVCKKPMPKPCDKLTVSKIVVPSYLTNPDEIAHEFSEYYCETPRHSPVSWEDIMLEDIIEKPAVVVVPDVEDRKPTYSTISAHTQPPKINSRFTAGVRMSSRSIIFVVLVLSYCFSVCSATVSTCTGSQKSVSTPISVGMALAQSGASYQFSMAEEYTQYSQPITAQTFTVPVGVSQPSVASGTDTTCNSGANTASACTCKIQAALGIVNLYPGATIQFMATCGGLNASQPITLQIQNVLLNYKPVYQYSTTSFSWQTSQSWDCTGSCTGNAGPAVCCGQGLSPYPFFYSEVNNWSFSLSSCCYSVGQGYLCAGAQLVPNNDYTVHIFDLQLQSIDVVACVEINNVITCCTSGGPCGFAVTVGSVPTDIESVQVLVGMQYGTFQGLMMGPAPTYGQAAWNYFGDLQYQCSIPTSNVAGTNLTCAPTPGSVVASTTDPVQFGQWVFGYCSLPNDYGNDASVNYPSYITTPNPAAQTPLMCVWGTDCTTYSWFSSNDLGISLFNFTVGYTEEAAENCPTFSILAQYLSESLTGTVGWTGTSSITITQLQEFYVTVDTLTMLNCTGCVACQAVTYCYVQVEYDPSYVSSTFAYYITTVTNGSDYSITATFTLTPTSNIIPLRATIYNDVSTVAASFYLGGVWVFNAQTSNLFIEDTGGIESSGTTTTTGGSTVQTTSASYDPSTNGNSAMPAWEVAVIVISCIIGLILLAIIIYYIVKSCNAPKPNPYPASAYSSSSAPPPYSSQFSMPNISTKQKAELLMLLIMLFGFDLSAAQTIDGRPVCFTSYQDNNDNIDVTFVGPYGCSVTVVAWNWQNVTSSYTYIGDTVQATNTFYSVWRICSYQYNFTLQCHFYDASNCNYQSGFWYGTCAINAALPITHILFGISIAYCVFKSYQLLLRTFFGCVAFIFRKRQSDLLKAMPVFLSHLLERSTISVDPSGAKYVQLNRFGEITDDDIELLRDRLDKLKDTTVPRSTPAILTIE